MPIFLIDFKTDREWPRFLALDVSIFRIVLPFGDVSLNETEWSPKVLPKSNDDATSFAFPSTPFCEFTRKKIVFAMDPFVEHRFIPTTIFIVNVVTNTSM